MTSQKLILVIDDDQNVGLFFAQLLQQDYIVEFAVNGVQGLKKIQELDPDLILLDQKMPQMGGLEVLRRLSAMNARSPVIIMTAYGDIGSAIEAMKLGAVDYVMKPFDHEKLLRDIGKALSIPIRSERVLAWRDKIIGHSPQMQKVWRLIEKFAPSDATILLQGESGTGKTLCARAIHEMSKRGEGPFVAVECALWPDALMEGELFGSGEHVPAGANERTPGRFELADRGTLFLDEVESLSPAHQMKLLRVIQQSSMGPLGSPQARPLDIRIVAASHVPLKNAADKGAFRSDLYYRLGTVTIDVPPLRERQGDLPLLTDHFAQMFSKKFHRNVAAVSSEVRRIFEDYAWPGNVRELEDVMRWAVLSADEEILPAHLPAYFPPPHT